MAFASIDGDNLLAVLPSGVPTFDVQADFYSDWMKWQLLGDNLRYEPMFAPSTGGIPTVPGESQGPGFFFRNDLGWRIRPAEEDGNLVIGVNLYAAAVNEPIFTPTLGGFAVFVAYQFSSLALVKETGVSGLTPPESQSILDNAANNAANAADNATNAANLAQIATDIGNFQITPQRAQAWPNFQFNLVQSLDHASPATGLAATITARICQDGGAWAGLGGTVTEIGLGLYRIDLSGPEMDFVTGTLMFSEPTADPIKVTIRTAP